MNEPLGNPCDATVKKETVHPWDNSRVLQESRILKERNIYEKIRYISSELEVLVKEKPVDEPLDSEIVVKEEPVDEPLDTKIVVKKEPVDNPLDSKIDVLVKEELDDEAPLDSEIDVLVKEETVDESLDSEIDELAKEESDDDDAPLDIEMDVLAEEEPSVNRSISGNKQRVYFIGDSQINILVKTNLFREYDVVNWAFPGKRTDEILEEVRNKIQERTREGDKVGDNAIAVIWVGTNDVLQGKCVETFIKDFRSLMYTMKRFFKRTLLVTLPPIMKDPHRTPCKESVIKMNKFIASYKGSQWGRMLKSVNLSTICLKQDGSVRLELYEQKIGNKFTRDDKIQLNLMAFKIIASKMKDILCLL